MPAERAPAADFDFAASGRRVLATEVQGLEAIAARIDGAFSAACRLLLACRGRVVCTGMNACAWVEDRSSGNEFFTHGRSAKRHAVVTEEQEGLHVRFFKPSGRFSRKSRK